MPIDASIYGQVQTPPPINPFAIAFQMRNAQIQRSNQQALEEQRAALAQERQQQISDKGAMDSAVSQGGSSDDIIARLPGHMQAAAREAFGKADEAAAAAKAAQTKADAANADYFGQLASSVKGFGYDPTAAAMALQHAQAAGHDTTQIQAQIKQFGLQPVVDNLIAASPAQRELVTKETEANAKATEAKTGADKFAAEQPGIVADSAVKQQVAAGTVNGITPQEQIVNADAQARARLAYAQYNETVRHNKADEAAAANARTDNQQDKLEQQYRGVLEKELSSRSGGLGTEDQKVNQAIHLKALMDQNYDPKTGQYNIPQAQYAELATGLAALVNPRGTPSDAQRQEIETRTAKGDLNGAIGYVLGKPLNASTQDMYNMLHDSIMRQGTVAEQNRGTYLDAIRKMAPTQLDPTRKAALEQSLQLNSLAPKPGTTIGRFTITGIQ